MILIKYHCAADTKPLFSTCTKNRNVPSASELKAKQMLGKISIIQKIDVEPMAKLVLTTFHRIDAISKLNPLWVVIFIPDRPRPV